MVFSAENVGRIVHRWLVNRRLLRDGTNVRVVTGGNDQGPCVRIVLPPLMGYRYMGCMSLAAPLPMLENCKDVRRVEEKLAAEFCDVILDKVRQYDPEGAPA